MIFLSAKIRKNLGKKVKILRKKGVLPAILYGPKIKNLNLEINSKEFEKIYKEAGESSLISLNVEEKKQKPSTRAKLGAGLVPHRPAESGTGAGFLVLIHDIQFDLLTGKPIHVDFYQPSLEEEVEVTVPLIFEGVSPAVKDFGGTLVKNISELKIKAKPRNLPHEIKVNIENLKTFEDNILIKDLKLPEEVKVQREPEEIVAHVLAPVKVEEELVKPVEEKVEEVEKVEEKKEEIEEK